MTSLPRRASGPRAVPRRRAVLVSAVLGVALLATGPVTWVRGRTWTALAEVEVAVPGTRAAPVVAAAGVLVLAAALALAVARRRAAVLAAGMVVLGAALAALGVVTVLADVAGVARAGAVHDVGVGATVTDAGATGAPWLVLVLAGLGAAAGVLAGRAARSWTVSPRHDAPAAARPRDDWEALTMGEDPTDDDGAAR